MSKSTITIYRAEVVTPVFLKVEAGVRHWEDATINGEEDTDGNLIPFRKGNIWAPTINLEAGTVINWPGGTTADVHFKVCDDGRYSLLDADMKVLTVLDGYVPKIMAPGGNGYGDYFIMTIGPDGKIANWKVDLTEFQAAIKSTMDEE